MSFIENLPEHFENELCPSCRSHDKRRQEWIGKLVRRSSKFGKFLGCSRYPDCKGTYILYSPELKQVYHSPHDYCATDCYGKNGKKSADVVL